MKRQLRNNIVIVCEGTDTEVGYLTELAGIVSTHHPERFSRIRIVPTDKELKECEKRNALNKKRHLKEPKKYYVNEEPEDDAVYSQQPTCYVREAQLFLIDGSFSEAWAVYDHDNFPDHENARALADTDPKVKIAFSSISFEEWLLLHFEHNPKAFQRSVCKEKKKDIECGTGKHPNDCHGEKCIGGRLRSMRYIPNYDKKGFNLYSMLEPRLEYARIGAAKLRSLNIEAPIWERNPYTDFDKLVDRLLGEEHDYVWEAPGNTIELEKTDVKVDGRVMFNVGSSLFIGDVKFYDSDFKEKGTKRVQLEPAESETFPDGDYISFKRRNRTIFVRI